MKYRLSSKQAEGAPNAVALLHDSSEASALLAPLEELDPSTVSVVVWRAAGACESTELRSIARQTGFTLQEWTDGGCLLAGRIYLAGPHRRAWFDGAHLREAEQRQPQPGALDHALQTLAQAWGQGSIVVSPAGLSGEGERGLTAVLQAGGKVVTGRGSDADRAPVSRSVVRGAIDVPSSDRAPRSQRKGPPPFRVRRLFSFSAAALARLRATAALAVRRAHNRDRVRVWVPACKTGSLVYAVAMVLLEVIANEPSPPRVQVFGTDADEEALALARAGRYPASVAVGMDPELRWRYTVDEGDTIRIADAVREDCFFSSHKLMRTAPFSRIDMIVCQRAFQGIGAPRRAAVLDGLYFALREEGVLFALDHSRYFLEHRFDLMPEGYFRPRPMPTQALRARMQAIS